MTDSLSTTASPVHPDEPVHRPRRRIGEVLVEQGLISRDQLTRALAAHGC